MATEEDLYGKLKPYRYAIEQFGFIVKGESKPISVDKEQVKSITIIKDYDNDFLPIINIKMAIDVRDYHKILTNVETTVLDMKITKYKYDAELLNDVFKEQFLFGKFMLFVEETTPFFDKSFVTEKANLEAQADLPDNKDKFVEFEFHVFNIDHLSRYKTPLNVVFKGAKIDDMILYGLNTCGIDAALMTPSHNKSSYNDLIFPPCTLQGYLYSIQNRCGIYTTGLRIFQDLNALYILDRSPDCTAFKKNEVKDVYILINSEMDENAIKTGCYLDSKGKKYIVSSTSQNVRISTPSLTLKELLYDGVKVVNSKSNSVKEQRFNLKSIGTRPNFKILEDRYNNPYLVSSQQTALEENNTLIEIDMDDIDFDILTMNKCFVLKFSDADIAKSIGGKYRISSAILALNQTDGYFTSNSSASFKV